MQRKCSTLAGVCPISNSCKQSYQQFSTFEENTMQLNKFCKNCGRETDMET